MMDALIGGGIGVLILYIVLPGGFNIELEKLRAWRRRRG